MGTSVSSRVRKHRAKLRRAGMRPVQIWVPDTSDPGFIAECRRQSRLLNKLSPREKKFLEEWEKLADHTGWV